MNKTIQIIIGIIAVLLIGTVIAVSQRQGTAIEESEATEDASASSTPRSLSAYIQTGDVTVNGEKVNTTAQKVATISAVKTEILSASSVLVSWVTSLPVVTEIYYSTTRPAPNVTQLMVRDMEAKTAHAVELTSLSLGATYYYTILSANAKESIATTTGPGIFMTRGK